MYVITLHWVDTRPTSALTTIERAFNKVDKVTKNYHEFNPDFQFNIMSRPNRKQTTN